MSQLAELNPYVQVTASELPLTPEFLQRFGAVVCCETLPQQLLETIDNICRSRVIHGQECYYVLIFILL